jgi:hypothetical protein
MRSIAMAWPMVALAALTFVVTVVMYRRRLAELREKKIHPQALATSAQMAARLEDTKAADNYRNLHEAPTLFYAAGAIALALGLGDALLVGLAWSYVAARVAHTGVQLTTNRVRHRFQAFVASFALLVLLWIALAWRLATAAGG